MTYEFVAIPDADVPPAADPADRHLLDAYASETNKTPPSGGPSRTTGWTIGRTSG